MPDDYEALLGVLSAEARRGNTQPMAREIEYEWCRRTGKDGRDFLDHTAAAQEAGLVERWSDSKSGDWMELAAEGPPRPPPSRLASAQPTLTPENFHLADLDFPIPSKLSTLTSVQLLCLQFRDDFPLGEVIDSKLGLTGAEVIEEIWFKRATKDKRHGQQWVDRAVVKAPTGRLSPRPTPRPVTPPWTDRGRSDSLPESYTFPASSLHSRRRSSRSRSPRRRDSGGRSEPRDDRREEHSPRAKSSGRRQSSSGSSADRPPASRPEDQRHSSHRHNDRSRSRRRSAFPPPRSYRSPIPTRQHRSPPFFDSSQFVPSSLVESLVQIRVKFSGGLPMELVTDPTALHELFVERHGAVGWRVENPDSNEPVYRMLFHTHGEAKPALDWFGRLAASYWKSNLISAFLLQARAVEQEWRHWRWTEMSESFRRSYGVDLQTVDSQRRGVEGRGWQKFEWEVRREAARARGNSRYAPVEGRWRGPQEDAMWPRTREELDEPSPQDDFPSELSYDQPRQVSRSPPTTTSSSSDTPSLSRTSFAPLSAAFMPTLRPSSSTRNSGSKEDEAEGS